MAGPPQRILVTGNAGAGKSTYAAALAREHTLPFHSLDPIVWLPGWRKREPDERDALIASLCAESSWVIDGVSDIALAHADVVVFLDVPRRVSYWRVAKRNLPYLFRSRPGMPEGCPEIRVARRLVQLIWRFPTHVRPRIVSAEAEPTLAFVHCRWPERPPERLA